MGGRRLAGAAGGAAGGTQAAGAGGREEGKMGKCLNIIFCRKRVDSAFVVDYVQKEL